MKILFMGTAAAEGVPALSVIVNNVVMPGNTAGKKFADAAAP